MEGTQDCFSRDSYIKCSSSTHAGILFQQAGKSSAHHQFFKLAIAIDNFIFSSSPSPIQHRATQKTPSFQAPEPRSMVIEALCYPSPLSNPIKLQTFRNTQKQSIQYTRTMRPVARAAVRTGTGGDVGTLYDLLELSPDVGISEIKQAYRQMARRYHPDVRPSHQAEESTRRFIEIQQAYETLLDPRTRAVYDHAVAMGRTRSAATGRCMPYDMDNQFSQWKSQWESQLSELRRRSSMKAGKTDSWSARVRRENVFCDA